MDSSSISAQSAQEVQAQAAVAMLRQAWRQQRIEGAAALRLIDGASPRVRQPGETGSLIDVTA